jgi:hypothetical protein
VELFQEYLNDFKEMKGEMIFIVEDPVSNLPLNQLASKAQFCAKRLFLNRPE